MSARIVGFQFHIEQKLEDQFSNFRADILGLRNTLRQELSISSSFTFGIIPSANVPSYRSISGRIDKGDFKDFQISLKQFEPKGTIIDIKL